MFTCKESAWEGPKALEDYRDTNPPGGSAASFLSPVPQAVSAPAINSTNTLQPY